jgi:hypothetical protein
VRRPAIDRATATAAGFGGKPKPRKLRISKWVPVGRKGLAGFVSVEFAIGLRIAGLPVFSRGVAGPWVGQPGVPALDRDHRQMRDDTGKLLFEPAFVWRDRPTADRFSAAVLQLLLARYPDALGERDDQRAQPAAAASQRQGIPL